MRATSQLIAFTPARDLRRAKSLYEGVLGLRFAEQDDFAIVLDADGTMVRVAKVPEFEPAPYTFWDGKSPLSKAQSRRSRNAASIANGTSYGPRRARHLDFSPRGKHRLVQRPGWERSISHTVSRPCNEPESS